MTASGPSFWDLVEQALAIEDARTMHLAVGRPPLVRVGEEGLRPIDESHPVLTHKTISLMLSLLVEPERWDWLENCGEGELTLARGIGRPITANVFRTSGSWSVVVHF
jgi:hypothetical protein